MRKKKLQRKFKDRLFLISFSERKDLLELYNAMHGTDYQNPDDLQITTLDDVIYIGVKNDVSFLLDDMLNLWEHQSTPNPNMPIRGLSYLAELYQKYIEQNNINIYSRRLQKLPFPQYVIFYNGTDEEPDRVELKLSDAFIRPAQASRTGEENVVSDEDSLSVGISGDLPLDPCLEIKATMLNINLGHNRELMERCSRLKEYAQFVDRVRGNIGTGKLAIEAVNEAVDSCIRDGILGDILSAHKAEVVAMFLYEYDEEKYRKMEREEMREEVRGEVLEEVREEVRGEVREEVREEVRGEVLEEVREEVLTEGAVLKVIAQSRKQYRRGVSAENCADVLDEDPALIQSLYELFAKHEEWKDDKIWKALQGRTGTQN